MWLRALMNVGIVGLILTLSPLHPSWYAELPEGRWLLALMALWGASEWAGLRRASTFPPPRTPPPQLGRWIDRMIAVLIVAALTIGLRLWEGGRLPPAYRLSCVGLAAGGVALRTWAMWVLGPAFTAGLELRQPAVTRGPYRLLKHPAYAGLLLVLYGLMGLLQSRSGLALVTGGVLPLLAARGWLERRGAPPPPAAEDGAASAAS